MCIVFFWQRKFCSNIFAAPKYNFILAANRDEVFKRPSVAAHFWKEADHVVGGRDLTEGYEGGTWLAMTKSGKLGFLTNLPTGSHGNDDDKKEHRGWLISKYLTSSELDCKNYIRELDASKSNMRPFNLVLGNVLNGDGLVYTNNIRIAEPETLVDEWTCLTNATLGCTWMKAREGTAKFKAAVGKAASKEELIGDLLSLLQDDYKYDDPEVKDAHVSRRSVFVSCPEHDYGTRAQTVILVDLDNNVTFLERSLEQPISCHNPKWLLNTHEFKLSSFGKSSHM